MGVSNSKYTSKGALKGAYAPPLEGVQLPPKMDPTFRTYEATIPAGKGPGDIMIFHLLGHDVPITIPDKIKGKDGTSRWPRAGDKFQFTYGARDKVIASTLPSLPGTTVVEAKPMIFANVSHMLSHEQSRKVGTLMQEAQTILLQQAVEAGCNAVLSINCNITTDSFGDNGRTKLIIVTLVGTPCVVMRLDTLPAIEAEAVVVPAMVF